MLFELKDGMPVEAESEVEFDHEDYPHVTETADDASTFVDLCSLPPEEWQYW